MGDNNFSDPSLDDEFLLLESDDKNNNDTEDITLDEDEGLWWGNGLSDYKSLLAPPPESKKFRNVNWLAFLPDS